MNEKKTCGTFSCTIKTPYLHTSACFRIFKNKVKAVEPLNSALCVTSKCPNCPKCPILTTTPCPQVTCPHCPKMKCPPCTTPRPPICPPRITCKPCILPQCARCPTCPATRRTPLVTRAI